MRKKLKSKGLKSTLKSKGLLLLLVVVGVVVVGGYMISKSGQDICLGGSCDFVNHVDINKEKREDNPRV